MNSHLSKPDNFCCIGKFLLSFLFWLHYNRAFDVELLYIAQCFNIPIAEVAVNWMEIEG